MSIKFQDYFSTWLCSKKNNNEENIKLFKEFWQIIHSLFRFTAFSNKSSKLLHLPPPSYELLLSSYEFLNNECKLIMQLLGDFSFLRNSKSIKFLWLLNNYQEKGSGLQPVVKNRSLWNKNHARVDLTL